LNNRHDRFITCEENKRKLELPLEYFNAVKHPNSGKQGCFESHKKVLESHKDSENCLVFEDDFEISKNFKWELLEEVIRFMNTNKDWDIIYLGCFPDVWDGHQIHVSGHIFSVKATCMHAYIASKKCMQAFSKIEYTGKPVDELFFNYNTYALLPTIFRQKLSDSDISSLKFISKFKYRHKIENFVEYYAMEFGVKLKDILGLVACVTLLLLLIHYKIKNGN
jgi:GR25 family glycosyltransferase involved in LPS biosynthesis